MLVTSEPGEAELRAMVADIQAAAWARLGVDRADLAARFAARREAYRDLARTNPDYQDFAWGVDPDVAAAHGLPTGVEGLWTSALPTELQDPAAYASIDLLWRYVGIHMPHRSEHAPHLLFATAPTGDFNALAAPFGAGGAIIVEEGLINLARRLCGIVTPVLYVSRQAALTIRTKAELHSLLDEDQTAAIEIAQLFMDYLTEDGVELPAVGAASIERPLEIRFADTLFVSFIAFVLWHEILHLEAAAGNPGVVQSEILAKDGVAMVQALRKIANQAGVEVDERRALATFARQREESEADTYAMIRCATYGSRTSTLPGTVTGAMTFMYALETLNRMLTQITDRRRYALEGEATLGQLRAAAILGDRDHPHPRVRREEMVAVITELNLGVGKMVGFEAERLDILFQFVWRYLEATLTVAADQVARRAGRWRTPARPQREAMTRALSATP